MRLKLMPALVIAIVLLVGVGCKAPAPGTPAVPDPPVVRVLKLTQISAVTVNTAAHTLKVLCAPLPPAMPTLDPATCSSTAVYLRTAAGAFDKIVLATGTPDAWSVMRLRIAAIAGTAITTTAVKDPALQAQISAIQNLVLQILEVR